MVVSPTEGLKQEGSHRRGQREVRLNGGKPD